MKERLFFIVLYFFYWVSLFIFQKPLFLLFQISQSSKESIGDLLKIIPQGLCMDISTSGYLTALPLLLTMTSCFTSSSSWLNKTTKYITYLFVVITSIIFTTDLFLYQNWGFRIDSSVLFYLQTPKDAMASVTWLQVALAVLTISVIILLSIKWYKIILGEDKKYAAKKIPNGCNFLSVLPLLLFAGLIFVGIRGGIGVSTMNTGRGYFSQSTFVNHATVNPIWNFIYSCTHTTKFEEKYRFMENSVACKLTAELNHTSSTDSTSQILHNQRPNVFLLIMEGIGSNVIETLGGEKGVTPNLSRYTKEGLLFSNFFASAVRTDRGLTAILSSYPAQPTNSIMKYANKTQNIPIITQKFKEAGYETAFYYGGDDNFTNLHSYLITAGYQTIINDRNFPREELKTKWGAYDHVLLQKVKNDLQSKMKSTGLKADSSHPKPLFYTILTLNSHEPFDVPTKKLEDPYLNSVFYADSCIGDFVEDIRRSELWDNSLIVILPDHAFRYPRSLSNVEPYRYRIPLIWLGGALKKQPATIKKTCGQIDLTATLLNQLNMDYSDFIFSHDILAKSYPEYAFFSYPDGFGLIHKSDTALFDCAGDKTIRTTNEKTTDMGKAYLQKLYDDLSKR